MISISLFHSVLVFFLLFFPSFLPICLCLFIPLFAVLFHWFLVTVMVLITPYIPRGMHIEYRISVFLPSWLTFACWTQFILERDSLSYKFYISDHVDPLLVSADMCRLTTCLRSEKYVVSRFRRCANVIECTYTNLDSLAYYTHSLYVIAYCS
jgi:hypothetical protein